MNNSTEARVTRYLRTQKKYVEKEHSVPGEKTHETGLAMWVGLIIQLFGLDFIFRAGEKF